MNLTLAIMRREMIAIPRRRRFYRKRAWMVALVGFVLIWGLAVSGSMNTTTLGLQIFSYLSMSVLFAVWVMAMANASALIMREKEERTFGLLFLSDISTWNFVFGKLATSMFSMVMAILSVLPMFLLCISLGGVSAAQIMAAFGILLSTVLLSAAFGILVSSFASTERAMNSLLALICMLLYVIPPIAITMRAALTNAPEPPLELLCAMSPFVAMGALTWGHAITAGLLNCGISAGLALCILWLSGFVVRRRISTSDRAPMAQRIKERFRSVTWVRRWTEPCRIVGNPVTWRELNYVHGGPKGVWVKFLVAALGYSLIPGLVYYFDDGHMKAKDVAETFLIAFLLFSGAIVGLGSVSHCGMAFNKEKKDRALELLLTTSLSDAEIVKGKVAAVALSLQPWIILFAVSFLCVVVFVAPVGFFWEAGLFMLFEYLGTLYCYSCLALWISLRYRRNAAFAICTLAFLLWNSLGRTIVMSLMIGMHSPFGAVVAIDFLFYAGVGTLSLVTVIKRFRQVALREMV